MKVFWILLLYNVLVSQCYAVLTKSDPVTQSITLDVAESVILTKNLQTFKVSGTTATVMWTVEGTDASGFSITSSTPNFLEAELKLKRALDFENAVLKEFTISANDGTTKVIWTVTIHVKNVFDVAPTFTGAPYTCDIDEETTDSCSMISVSDIETTYTDADKITCSLTGTDSDKFNIESPSCKITPKAAIDYEDTDTSNTYNLDIKASDKIQNSAVAKITINIIDKNEHAPICTPNPATATKLESYTGDVNVIKCTDKDSGSNAKMTCSTTESRVAVSMSGTSCAVKINKAIDYETMSPKTITFNILVKDSPTDTSVTKTTTVPYLLTIENVYDVPPKFTAAHYDCYIPEESTVPCTIPSVSDSEVGDEITCSLSGSYASLFNIYSPNCTTSLKAGIDHDTNVLPNNYSLTIKATDKGGTYSQATLDITIGDKNDNIPVCLPTSVVEKATKDFVGELSRIKCFDKDSGDFGKMFCSTSDKRVITSMSELECIVSIKDAIDADKLDNKTILFNIVVRDNPKNATTFLFTTIPFTLTMIVDNWYEKPEYIALIVLAALLLLLIIGVTVGCCMKKSSSQIQDSTGDTSDGNEPRKISFKERDTAIFRDVNPYKV